MKNNKIKREINDVVNDNLKALEQLFPSAVKDGQLDIKALKEELGDFEEVGNERYELNWAGKQNAKKIVQQGIGNKTLKFVEKDSKNADTTENIYIEGDNLEVLKLLYILTLLTIQEMILSIMILLKWTRKKATGQRE